MLGQGAQARDAVHEIDAGLHRGRRAAWDTLSQRGPICHPWPPCPSPGRDGWRWPCPPPARPAPSAPGWGGAQGLGTGHKLLHRRVVGVHGQGVQPLLQRPARHPCGSPVAAARPVGLLAGRTQEHPILAVHHLKIVHHNAANIDTGIAPQGAHRLDGPYHYLDRQRGGLDGFFHPELYRLVNADALALRQLRDGASNSKRFISWMAASWVMGAAWFFGINQSSFKSLMGPEDTPGDTARFEQHETQKHRVAHSAPNGADGVAAGGDALDEHRVDRHAHQDEQPLESDGEQGLDVVLAHAPQLPVGKGRHRDGGQTGHDVDFQHTAIHDNENDDVQRKHTHLDKNGLHEQPQQGADAHALQRGLQVGQHIRRNIRGALDEPGRAGNHALRHVEHRHDNIKRVGKNQDGDGRLEHPLVDVRHVNLVHIVLFQKHLNELIGGNEGQHHARYRQDHRLGELPDQGEHPGVPRRRGGSHLCRYVPD